MNLPITINEISDVDILVDSIDYDELLSLGMSNEQIVSFCFEYAKKNKIRYFQSVNISDGDSCIAYIFLEWGSASGFSASLLIEYDTIHESDTYKIPLEDVPLKVYDKTEIYDFDVIVLKGIELFNKNFDLNLYEVYHK